MEYAFTVFAVSVDAFMASFAYSANTKLDNLSIFYAGLFTFLFSIFALVLNYFCVKNLPYIAVIGGLIFILLGVKNYLEFFIVKENLLSKMSKSNPTLLGIGVSVDACIACLSVNIESDCFILFYAFLMYFGHYFFLILGAKLSQRILATKVISLLSGLCLIALGIYRLI